MRDARSASHWFPPHFPKRIQNFWCACAHWSFAEEEVLNSKLCSNLFRTANGLIARLIRSLRSRANPKIFLTFLLFFGEGCGGSQQKMERKFLVLLRRFKLWKEQSYFNIFVCSFLRPCGETRRFLSAFDGNANYFFLYSIDDFWREWVDKSYFKNHLKDETTRRLMNFTFVSKTINKTVITKASMDESQKLSRNILSRGTNPTSSVKMIPINANSLAPHWMSYWGSSIILTNTSSDTFIESDREIYFLKIGSE